ncbi:HD-GYP domain-containing protein [bacterium]|nr:HD-GYP domain-containing protein [bacterium]
MVRLTDLVGSKNGQAKENIPRGTSDTPKKDEYSGGEGFLKASDLSNIYEIPSQSPEIDDVSEIYREYPQENGKSHFRNSDAERKSEFHEKPDSESVPETTDTVVSPDAVQDSHPRHSPEKVSREPGVYTQETGITTVSSVDEKMQFELADAIHIELLDILDDIYQEGKEDIVPGVERLIDPVMRLIEVCRNTNAILRKAVRLKKGRETFTTHSLNVAILSIKIGISRGYSPERLFSLGLCALLGDIGMTKVDPAILTKKGKLEPEEFQEIKNHILYSSNIAEKVTDRFPFLAPIIYQIHERENGSGYPEGLRGGNIHEFAKIIGLCDVYIAMTSPKAHREDFSGYETLQQILSRRGIDFHPSIIKSLIDVISVFPIESLVKLNNGEIGRVIDISSVHPTRPKLNILVSSDGERLKTGKIVDLEKEPLLYIEDPDIEEGVII